MNVKALLIFALVLLGLLVGLVTAYVVHEHPTATNPVIAAAAVLALLASLVAIVFRRT